MFKRILLLVVSLMLPLHVVAQEDEWVEYTSTDGIVAFSHPADWVVQEQEGMVGMEYRIATSQSVLDSELPPAKGQATLSLIFMPLETLQTLLPELDPTVETFYGDALAGLADYLLAQVEETEATETPTVISTPEPEGTVEPLDLPFVLTEMDDGSFMFEFTESGHVLYGRELGDYLGAEADVVIFDVSEEVLGVAIISGAYGETETRLALQALDVLDSVAYTE